MPQPQDVTQASSPQSQSSYRFTRGMYSAMTSMCELNLLTQDIEWVWDLIQFQGNDDMREGSLLSLLEWSDWHSHSRFRIHSNREPCGLGCGLCSSVTSQYLDVEMFSASCYPKQMMWNWYMILSLSEQKCVAFLKNDVSEDDWIQGWMKRKWFSFSLACFMLAPFHLRDFDFIVLEGAQDVIYW